MTAASTRAPAAPLGEHAHERRVSEFLELALERRRRSPLWFVAHPCTAVSGFAAVHRLPLVTARLGAGPESAAVRRGLLRGHPMRRRLLGGATAVLELPDEAAAHLVGASRQTLRRKIRAAQRLGVTWRRIDDSDERERLLLQLDESERTHVRETYRHVQPSNQDLRDVGQWLAAFAADGRAVLLSVTPVDGDWAVLRTFRALEDSDEASTSRYLMSQVLVETLVERGVRHLADTQSPASLPPGLRFFQRMIGYRLVRVRFRTR